MAPPKAKWPAKAQRKFDRMAKEGASAKAIAAALSADGVPGASEASVGRRLRELLGDRRAGKSVGQVAAVPLAEDGAPSDIPTAPDELAEAPLEQLAWWLDEVQRAFKVAKKAGNVAAQSALAARATALLEARRKGAPPPPVDPNEAIDIRLAAQKGRALFFETLENIIGNRGVL